MNVEPTFIKTSPIFDEYEFGKELGRGSFSIVYEGRHKVNGSLWAIKQLTKARITDLKKVKNREIAIMMQVKHPNIVCLQEVFEDEKYIHLVLQLVPGGELFEKILDAGHFTEVKASTIIRQVLQGIQYLHHMNIVHRDLKPENLLCQDNNTDRVLIADFGFARAIQDNQQIITQCGSLHYTAPEILTGEPYGPSVDMWSVGVILYVLLTGCFPWDGGDSGEDYKNILGQITNVVYAFPRDIPISNQAKHFISQLLVKEPQKRFTPEQALNHPWVQGKDVSSIALSRSFIGLSEFKKSQKDIMKKLMDTSK